MKPKIIAIAGTSSNTGKTTLLCHLLRELSKDETWEAIKLTRGHYRSCGKDPHACCVSHLLSDQPTVRSGREETYAFGKDTGRYWDAGASNVHWVIATDSQVEAGINEALSRVKSLNILIEGTSLLQFVQTDFAILATGTNMTKPKASVRRALSERKINALYRSDEYLQPEGPTETKPDELFAALSRISLQIDSDWLTHLPIFSSDDLPQLITLINDKKS